MSREEQEEEYRGGNESGRRLVLKWQARAGSPGYYRAGGGGLAPPYSNEVGLIAEAFNEKLQAQDSTNFFHVQDDLSAWLSGD